MKARGNRLNFAKIYGGEASTRKHVTITWVRISENISMRSIIPIEESLEFL